MITTYQPHERETPALCQLSNGIIECPHIRVYPVIYAGYAKIGRINIYLCMTYDMGLCRSFVEIY